MSLQQSVLQTYEKKQFIVNVHQGRNLVNPNVSSEVVEPLVWFKFQNFNERWTESKESNIPEWNSNFNFDIYMNTSMIKQLETESLIFYVMDNKAPENQNEIGQVDLPLYKVLAEGFIRDWYPVKNVRSKNSIGMVYLEVRLDKAKGSSNSKFKDVSMVDQIVRDKLNECHKRAKAVEQADFAFKWIFEKNLVDFYTFKKCVREKLRIVVDEIVADKLFKVLSDQKQSFDKNAWVETLNKNDQVGDFDIIETKVRELFKANEQLWNKLEINDSNNNDTLELFLCGEILFEVSEKSEFRKLNLTKGDIEQFLKNSR